MFTSVPPKTNIYSLLIIPQVDSFVKIGQSALLLHELYRTVTHGIYTVHSPENYMRCDNTRRYKSFCGLFIETGLSAGIFCLRFKHTINGLFIQNLFTNDSGICYNENRFRLCIAIFLCFMPHLFIESNLMICSE